MKIAATPYYISADLMAQCKQKGWPMNGVEALPKTLPPFASQKPAATSEGVRKVLEKADCARLIEGLEYGLR